jgi:(2Fe-2S) ferredoxin
MPPFQKHIFICVNRRDPSDPRGCCAAKGSEAIRDYFKAEIKKRGLQGKMRANAAGCLDNCSAGPTVVVYPEGIWYRVPTVEDAREIIERHLENGEVVDRLRLYR